jgi:hypothetical protein
MPPKLKYQHLIDKLGLSVPCPERDAHEVENSQPAFRWCWEPLDQNSFLPNLAEDAIS